jgi:hypothetical protein
MAALTRYFVRISALQGAEPMQRAVVSRRIGIILMMGAIFIAPFVAWLFRAEAGLLVMAMALGATSLLLRDALPATPLNTRRLLRLVIAIDVTLAVACMALAAWLVTRG